MTFAAEVKTTPEEYLILDSAADQKSEYMDGEMIAMAGASPEHVLVAVNVAGELRAQLKGRPCRVFSADMRVRLGVRGPYVYPDVVVVCGEPRYGTAKERALLNPTLIVEVLSPSTEAYDRGEKFLRYQAVESLQEYVLIAQDQVRIEQFVRQTEGGWLYSECHDPVATVALPSIGCALALAEVYDKVDASTDGAHGSGSERPISPE